MISHLTAAPQRMRHSRRCADTASWSQAEGATATQAMVRSKRLSRARDRLGQCLLEIKNLHVEIDGKEILKGLDLTVNAGEVHAIMGPNGSGKSTLAYVLAGKADYTPTAGEVRFDGKNIFDMAPDERAAAGLFLAFQYPLEIPGVATMTFLRTALNAQRKKRGEAELSTPEFLKKVREVAGQARHRAGDAAPRASMSAFPAARRSATRFCRWRCSSRGSPCSTRPIPASTSTRCKHRLRRRQPAARAGARLRRHHPLSAAAQLHRARRGARAVEGPHRQDRRQGVGARARSARLCRISGRGCRRERRSRHHQDRGGDRAGAGLFAGARPAARR